MTPPLAGVTSVIIETERLRMRAAPCSPMPRNGANRALHTEGPENWLHSGTSSAREPRTQVTGERITEEKIKMPIYVLVHGAWHTGAELEATAAPIRAAGHEVHTPTIAGNRPGDPKTAGLGDAINSIVDYLNEKDLKNVILVGHSYGGMVITGVADQVPIRIRRLVYWNAFVPNSGESVNDMVPPPYVALFEQIAAQRGDNSVVLPFPIWREAFINDVDLASAQKAYDILNPHPAKTLSDKILLKTNPADMQIAKSYINCTEDTSLPHDYPWHPRLSRKLGLFRLVQVRGSHELCFSNPKLLAQAIMDAGRD